MLGGEPGGGGRPRPGGGGVPPDAGGKQFDSSESSPKRRVDRKKGRKLQLLPIPGAERDRWVKCERARPVRLQRAESWSRPERGPAVLAAS
jgi:hypothetical protein